jgi:hypothetical protein
MYTEEEIIAFLDGPYLAQYHFLVRGAIVRWNPKSLRLSFVLEDDENVVDACEAYLSSNGRKFSSIDELVDYAKENRWPGCELIKRDFEDPPDDRGSSVL